MSDFWANRGPTPPSSDDDNGASSSDDDGPEDIAVPASRRYQRRNSPPRRGPTMRSTYSDAVPHRAPTAYSTTSHDFNEDFPDINSLTFTPSSSSSTTAFDASSPFASFFGLNDDSSFSEPARIELPPELDHTRDEARREAQRLADAERDREFDLLISRQFESVASQPVYEEQVITRFDASDPFSMDSMFADKPMPRHMEDDDDPNAILHKKYHLRRLDYIGEKQEMKDIYRALQFDNVRLALGGTNPDTSQRPIYDIHTVAGTVKIVVVGDDSSGKTSLVTTFATYEFPTGGLQRAPPVVRVGVDHPRTRQKLNLEIWDTKEIESRQRAAAYENADVIIAVFSVVDLRTFDGLARWVNELNALAPHVPRILVGAKTDLRDDPVIAEKMRVAASDSGAKFVNNSLGTKAAKKIGARIYLECSSKKYRGVKEVFEEVVRVVIPEPVVKKGLFGTKKTVAPPPAPVAQRHAPMAGGPTAAARAKRR